MTAERQALVDSLVQEMPRYISASVRYQIAVADQLGMPLADVHAVGALLELGPTGARALADVMGMTSGAVTRLVDRLEAGGFVRREPDPSDRRRVVLRVVPERARDISRYYEPMGDRWQRQVEEYTDDELRFLAEFLRRGGENARVETAQLRSRGRRHATRRPQGKTLEDP